MDFGAHLELLPEVNQKMSLKFFHYPLKVNQDVTNYHKDFIICFVNRIARL
jgi:hypothetical protein